MLKTHLTKICSIKNDMKRDICILYLKNLKINFWNIATEFYKKNCFLFGLSSFTTYII